MSILSRGRTALANLLGIQAVAAAITPQRVEVADDQPMPARRAPVAKTKGRARIRYFGDYNGGKHRRGVPSYIMVGYVDAAQAKRERKNAKRAREFGYA